MAAYRDAKGRVRYDSRPNWTDDALHLVRNKRTWQTPRQAHLAAASRLSWYDAMIEFGAPDEYHWSRDPTYNLRGKRK